MDEAWQLWIIAFRARKKVFVHYYKPLLYNRLFVGSKLYKHSTVPYVLYLLNNKFHIQRRYMSTLNNLNLTLALALAPATILS
jgi:hypothetical protein